MSKFAIWFGSIFLITVLCDIYFYFGVKSVFGTWKVDKYFKLAYWIVSGLYYIYTLYGLYLFVTEQRPTTIQRSISQIAFFALFLPKLLACTVLLVDDIVRLFRWVGKLVFDNSSEEGSSGRGVSRLRFLQVTALSVFGLFLSTLSYGIVRGAYRYNVINKKLGIKNLPQGFEGLKIVQISDLHVGSFFSTDPIKEAVGLINDLKPDMIFFTGDLVNDVSEEALDFVDVLGGLKAKYGIYSVLGNHDYGDYVYREDDVEKKAHNKRLMKEIHERMGFKLLLNDNEIFEAEGGRLAVIGVENWGRKFAQYGKLEEAIVGTDTADVKLLLSHDPSHWDGEVKPKYKDINVTFSGHTHGMQFGVEVFGIKWSPAKWAYKQWAGLYKEGEQQLYVNRGLGFVGYPGRVGISPEITLFELQRA